MSQEQIISILLLKTSRWCAKCLAEKQLKVHATEGVSIGDGPFEPLCRHHMPPGALQEFWTRRLFQGLRDGKDDETMHAVLNNILMEVRLDTEERCAKIADVVAQDAQLAYSDKSVASEVRRAANDIAFSIRTMEHDS